MFGRPVPHEHEGLRALGAFFADRRVAQAKRDGRPYLTQEGDVLFVKRGGGGR